LGDRLAARAKHSASCGVHAVTVDAAENWRENAGRQGDYAGALCRHLVAEHGGEAVDPESGVPHVAHAAASALIWLWHERRREAP
jgi:hypothetical protein